MIDFKDFILNEGLGYARSSGRAGNRVCHFSAKVKEAIVSRVPGRLINEINNDFRDVKNIYDRLKDYKPYPGEKVDKYATELLARFDIVKMEIHQPSESILWPWLEIVVKEKSTGAEKHGTIKMPNIPIEEMKIPPASGFVRSTSEYGEDWEFVVDGKRFYPNVEDPSRLKAGQRYEGNRTGATASAISYLSYLIKDGFCSQRGGGLSPDEKQSRSSRQSAAAPTHAASFEEIAKASAIKHKFPSISDEMIVRLVQASPEKTVQEIVAAIESLLNPSA